MVPVLLTCKELKESVGCIRPLGFTQDYGIGMNLYFKFVKTLNVAFFFATMAAFLAMSYYWSTSAWTRRRRRSRGRAASRRRCVRNGCCRQSARSVR